MPTLTMKYIYRGFQLAKALRKRKKFINVICGVWLDSARIKSNVVVLFSSITSASTSNAIFASQAEQVLVIIVLSWYA